MKRLSRTWSAWSTTPPPTPTVTSWPPPISWPGWTPTCSGPCACRPRPTGSKASGAAGMDLESLDAAFVIDTSAALDRHRAQDRARAVPGDDQGDAGGHEAPCAAQDADHRRHRRRAVGAENLCHLAGCPADR